MRVVIVSRHAGAVEWLRQKGIEGEVVPHLAQADIEGAGEETIFIGIFPVVLAVRIVQAGHRCWAIDLPLLQPEQRGKELSAGEMELAGAQLLELQLEHQYLGNDSWSPDRRGVPDAMAGDLQQFRIGLIPRSDADLPATTGVGQCGLDPNGPH